MTFLIRDEAAEGFVTVKEMSFWGYHNVGGRLPASVNESQCDDLQKSRRNGERCIVDKSVCIL
jgi:hypothetical protein